MGRVGAHLFVLQRLSNCTTTTTTDSQLTGSVPFTALEARMFADEKPQRHTNFTTFIIRGNCVSWEAFADLSASFFLFLFFPFFAFLGAVWRLFHTLRGS